MRIENTSLNPLAAKPTEARTSVERREEAAASGSVRAGQDKVEMSENARLLAKARAALGNSEDIESERLALLKQQIDSGDYTVQVGDLARKLLAKLTAK